MPINTGNFGELLEPGLDIIFGLEYPKYKQEWAESGFEYRQSSKLTEHILGLAGLGLLTEKAHGQGVTYDTMYQGAKTNATHVTYGLGAIITEEMYEFDQYDKINQVPTLLARSAAYTENTLPANILNRAFNTSYTGGDGQSLCSTAHVLYRGGTFKNRPTNHNDLSPTSFEQALIDIGDYVDDAGNVFPVMPKKLVIPTELDWAATTLLYSTLDPDTANNAVNPAKGRVPYFINHFLTDPDAWFIITDVPNGLIYYWNKKARFTRDNDFDSENSKFKVVMRCVPTWGDPRCIYGNAGA